MITGLCQAWIQDHPLSARSAEALNLARLERAIYLQYLTEQQEAA